MRPDWAQIETFSLFLLFLNIHQHYCAPVLINYSLSMVVYWKESMFSVWPVER